MGLTGRCFEASLSPLLVSVRWWTEAKREKRKKLTTVQTAEPQEERATSSRATDEHLSERAKEGSADASSKRSRSTDHLDSRSSTKAPRTDVDVAARASPSADGKSAGARKSDATGQALSDDHEGEDQISPTSRRGRSRSRSASPGPSRSLLRNKSKRSEGEQEQREQLEPKELKRLEMLELAKEQKRLPESQLELKKLERKLQVTRAEGVVDVSDFVKRAENIPRLPAAALQGEAYVDRTVSLPVRIPDFHGHEKRGQMLNVVVLGYVPNAHVQLVKDCADGRLWLVPGYAFEDGAPPKRPLSTEDIVGFIYPVQSKTQFTFGAGLVDENDGSITGQRADAIVLHHVQDADNRYYVIVRPDDYVRFGYRAWWVAFDVCPEDQLVSQ